MPAKGILHKTAKDEKRVNASSGTGTTLNKGLDMLQTELKLHGLSERKTQEASHELQALVLQSDSGQRAYTFGIKRILHYLRCIRKTDTELLLLYEGDLARAILEQRLSGAVNDAVVGPSSNPCGTIGTDGNVKLCIPPPMAADADKLCFCLRNLLTKDECKKLISRCDAEGWSPASLEYGIGSGDAAGSEVVNVGLRDSDRCIIFDDNLASILWSRLQKIIPTDAFWPLQAAGINECFRCLRYMNGQAGFAKHLDGSSVNKNGWLSRVTVQIYLNEVFQGGATRLCHEDDAKDATCGVNVIPETGMALVFDQKILHKGCPVQQGTKYTARTEIMYRGD